MVVGTAAFGRTAEAAERIAEVAEHIVEAAERTAAAVERIVDSAERIVEVVVEEALAADVADIVAASLVAAPVSPTAELALEAVVIERPASSMLFLPISIERSILLPPPKNYSTPPPF